MLECCLKIGEGLAPCRLALPHEIMWAGPALSPCWCRQRAATAAAAAAEAARGSCSSFRCPLLSSLLSTPSEAPFTHSPLPLCPSLPTCPRFPLNGTYFQVNEVFADQATAESPVEVCAPAFLLQYQAGGSNTKWRKLDRGRSLTTLAFIPSWAPACLELDGAYEVAALPLQRVCPFCTDCCEYVAGCH